MMKAKKVIDYYLLNNKLKDVIRTGWKNWKVSRERIESVAEHIYGTQCLAIAMYSEYEYEFDLKKVLYMLAVHELEETIIGDLTSWDISSEDKINRGHEAIKSILSKLVNGKEIEELILEFDNRSTKESKFAYHIDKMECNIQAKIYDEENCVDISKQDDNSIYFDDKVQSLLKQEKGSFSNMWIEYHKDKFLDDKNFMEIFNYIKNNDLTKN